MESLADVVPVSQRASGTSYRRILIPLTWWQQYPLYVGLYLYRGVKRLPDSEVLWDTYTVGISCGRLTVWVKSHWFSLPGMWTRA